MSKKNNHIVILTPGFPEQETDTACIPALQIYVKALREISGCDIAVVSLHYPKKKPKYFWNGIPVYTMGSSSVISKIPLWHRTYRLLKQINRDKTITALHSFWLGECALIGYWFSVRYQKKHITTIMGQDALKGNKYARILPLKKIPLITLSLFHQKVFNKNYHIQTAIIPFGIDPRDFSPSANKTIDIIGIGSLIPVKNYSLFIDVIAELKKTRPIKAVIIGDGVLQQQLEEKIRLLHLNDTILLKGKLPYKETMQYLAQSKILLHTSHHEGFGMIFAEALQSEAMIVSSEVGSATASSNCIIANTQSEMVEACSKLLSKSFSDEGRNPFLIEKTVQQYLDIYDH